MIQAEKLSIQVSEEYGSVSALLLLPEDATALLVLSHGAGAGMEHPFMETLAQSLATHGIATLRFNFLYMENGGGPDRPKKAHPAIIAALKTATPYAKGLKLLAGGKSFGGRMTSQVAATGALSEVQGVVYVGFPLHAPGKAGTERAAHLADITIPQLFLQGTRDTLAKFDLMEEVCGGLTGATLVKMEGADHSFKHLKRSGVSHEESIERLAVAITEFAARV